MTSYIESAAGVASGGRTGLVSLTVALLFLASLFFSPIISMIGSYPPATAPALVLVGALMAGNLGKIDWNDLTEAIPAFLIVLGIPLTFSIADGLAFGFIAYPALKWLSGRGRDVPWELYLLGALVAVYLLAIRSRFP